MSNDDIPMRRFPLDGYTIAELAEFYSQTIYVMEQWLAPHNEAIGIRNGRFFTPMQVKKILESIGPPKGYYYL